MARRAGKASPPPPAGGARRAWGWPLIAALLTIWGFVLGVLVGQGTLANQEQLAAVMRWARGLPLVGGWFAAEETPVARGLGELKLSFYNDIERRGAARPRSKPPAAAKPAEDTGRRYTVQVASFRDRKQAQKLVTRLKAAGFGAYLAPSEVKGVGLRYRVRVGSFRDFEKARATASRIRLGENLDTMVTREK